MTLEEMNLELLEEVTHLRNQNLSIQKTNKWLKKQLQKSKTSQRRELLITYHMNTLFDQKNEENRKFVEAAVDVYLRNL